MLKCQEYMRDGSDKRKTRRLQYQCLHEHENEKRNSLDEDKS